MIDIGDLKWAAGFLEGEGSFYLATNSPLIEASQNQKWPLEKLNSIFGGRLHFQLRKGNRNGTWVWVLGMKRKDAVALMMTLYILMSPRRQEQIKRCLNVWKKTKRNSLINNQLKFNLMKDNRR